MVYGKYVAKEPIDFNGVRAFQPGDPVPEDSVEAHGWEDLVEEASAPEADEPSAPGGQSTPPADPGSPAGKTAGPASKKPGGSRGASSGD